MAVAWRKLARRGWRSKGGIVAVSVQPVIDRADPGRLSRFYAAALGYGDRWSWRPEQLQSAPYSPSGPMNSGLAGLLHSLFTCRQFGWSVCHPPRRPPSWL